MDLSTLEMGLIGSVVLLFFVAFFGFLTRYKRCPSDRILVIYGNVGAGRSARCMHGGAAFVLPIVQDYQFLDLRPMSIDIQLNNALSKQNIRVSVPSTFTIGITTDPDKMGNAAERLLGFNNGQITQLAKEIIFGQMRQVVATMRIEEINADRDQLIVAITNNVSTELEKVGLRLINVNIQDVTDESGLHRGRSARKPPRRRLPMRRSRWRKPSAIRRSARRRADKEMTVSVAAAQADATQGKNTAQQQIAQSNADLRIKQAEAARTAQVAENVAKADVERQTFDAEGKAQEARAEMQRKQQFAEKIVPAQIAKGRAGRAVGSGGAAGHDCGAGGRPAHDHDQAGPRAVAAESEGKKNHVAQAGGSLGHPGRARRPRGRLRQARCLRGRQRERSGRRARRRSAPRHDRFADEGHLQSQDRQGLWSGGGGGDGAKGGISHLLKDLITGLPPVTELAKAAGIDLPARPGVACKATWRRRVSRSRRRRRQLHPANHGLT